MIYSPLFSSKGEMSSGKNSPSFLHFFWALYEILGLSLDIKIYHLFLSAFALKKGLEGGNPSLPLFLTTSIEKKESVEVYKDC